MSNGMTYRMRLWLMAVMTLLTAGCADYEADEAVERHARLAADSLYVNLRIINGSEGTATRATDADEQATAAENRIYDGILCIFVGTDESSAELKAACVIDQRIDQATTSASGNTSETKIIQRLPSEKLDLSSYNYDTNTLYALLLLNVSHTGLTVSSTGTLYYKGAAIPDADSNGKITITDLQQLELTSIGSIDESSSAPYADPSFHTGLFMSNAPRYESSSVKILTPISSSSLYANWDAASAGSNQTTIYVERAAAKVMVSSGTPTISFNLNESGTTSFHRMTWMPDNTAPCYYAVRNTVSQSDWTWSANMNWAYSPNYDGSATLNSIAGKEFSVYQQHSLKDGAVGYVMENTTNAANATPEHLTRVIVEVQVKDASSMLLGDCFAFNGVTTKLYTSSGQLITAMKSWWDTNKASLSTTYPDIYTKTADEIFLSPVVIINSDYSVTLTLTNGSFTVSEQSDLGKLANELSNKTIGYREGRMYYSATIQHTTGSPKAESPYNLGDYGVVRSNYYKLTLGNITNIGSPTPVQPYLVPISLKLYVVDWKSGGSFPLTPK